MRFGWLAAFVLMGCADLESLQTGPCEDAAPGMAVTCSLADWEERSYDLVIPERQAPQAGYPVVIAFHGGGGDRKGALRTTCPRGDIDAPECLHVMAAEKGYVVVAPDGTSGGIFSGRTWNAGGGSGSWQCASGKACEDNIDDVGFFDDLLADLEQRVAVDRDRVYLTGLSNGGAMAHRLACERSSDVAAIAAVGGALQFAVSDACEPERPVAVLQIHGDEDPCWPYGGGPSQCPTGDDDKNYVGVESTMTRWASLFGCTGQPLEDTLPDTQNDSTQTTRRTWTGCGAALQLLRINGGGHTWPNGFAYLGESVIGRVARDFGNEVILGFFERAP
jgi:polyhydroxybutyrate depolymerase